jgi:hypothetical protein
MVARSKQVWLASMSVVIAGGTALAAPGEASKALAVAPGEESAIVDVEDRCPTFHWAAAAGAQSHELVVYELTGPSGELEDRAAKDPHLVLEKRFPAGVHGWTPSLDQCLDRGASYAWSLRALSEEAPGAWSEPRLFRVAASPSAADVERALDVLRLFRESQGLEDRASSRPSDPALPRQVATPPTPVRPRDPKASTEVGPSTGIQAVTASTVDGSAGVVGRATGETGFTHGIIGEAGSPSGAGVLGSATAAAGADASGVVGSAGATSGQATGVYGRTFSPDGAGVKAANFDPAGGTDLLLDGGAQGLTDTRLTESGLDRASGAPENFSLDLGFSRHGDSGRRPPVP